MPVTIRSRLLLLVLSLLVPGMLGVAWLITHTFEAEREAHDRALRDSARALSMVVDRELAQRASIAHVLAGSRWLEEAPALSPEGLQRFRQLAIRALQGLDGWVELRGANGVLLDTRWPSTVPPAATASAAPAASAPLADKAYIEPLRTDSGVPHAAVVEPVRRGEQTVLNLAVTLLPQELQRIIDAQMLPPDWVGTVMDDRRVVVARHPGGSRNVGRPTTADLQEHLNAAREGLFEATSLDAARMTGYFSTSPQGWTYVSAMPRAQYAGFLPQAVQRIAFGALVLLALAVGGALWLSRRIARPVQSLKTAAQRMQAGLPVERKTTGIVECDEVTLAMAEAGEAIQHSRSDLERQVADAVARTRQAEQRASQGQRIEALGRLTGGVAHDFNNLLGVISNSAHLIERHPAAGELQMPVAALRRAVESGSQLTQHLLRFAGRKPVRPQALLLAHWLPEMQELLRSVLGRRIELQVRVAPDTAHIHADAGELELALVNLALNARDAMPSGGTLRVEARNARFGDPADPATDATEDAEGLAGAPARPYVLIAVSDDGSGIEPDVAARAFEPFFTTKAVGKGTGLGLSQVLGFCTQAGGTARLASTPGLGTTVSLLLPAGDGAQPAEAPAAATASAIAGARVLLVEDNEELGDVTAALLQAHGATLLRATDAGQALRLLAAQPLLDVVLSDVVMPGELDGLALGRRIRREHPLLPVVLISGYNTAATGSEFEVLRKPCPEPELLAALGRAIAGRQHAAPKPAPGG